MTGFSKRVLEMLVRLTVFAAMYPQYFGKDSIAGALMDEIIAAVQKLSAHNTSQTSGKSAVRVSNHARAQARMDLVTELETISRTAKGLQLREFFLPRDRSDRALVSIGRSFVSNVPQFKQQFIESQLPADFIEKLDAAVQNLEGFLVRQVFSHNQRHAATTAIELTRAEAISALQRLDPIMENALRNEPVILAVWQSSRHIERYSTSKSPKEGPPAQSPIPPPATGAPANPA
jgi:hypothetical protein